MENASKALLMAGGMLLAILLVSLLLYAWGLFSKYQSSQDSLAEIEDTAKFNEQFTAYDRNDVKGYELVSLINKVVDYNNRRSAANDAKNDEKYPPITLTIIIKDKGEKTKLKQLTMTGDKLRLFNNPTSTYIQDNATNTLKNSILDKTDVIEKRYGGSDCATKIVKSIDFNITNDASAQAKAVSNFKSYSKGNVAVNSWNDLQGEKENICTYYEYVQFKKAVFECNGKITYDNKLGRVSTITFEWTGDIK